MMVQAALNGTRTRAEHPAIPITPAQQATEAHASVAAGASGIHVHVRDEDGSESLAEADVANTIDAIRTACPGIPIGIGTGAWIIPDLRHRLSVIRSWSTLPDFASVNLHEAGATEVIELLLERGVGVEAGIWNAPAAASLSQEWSGRLLSSDSAGTSRGVVQRSSESAADGRGADRREAAAAAARARTLRVAPRRNRSQATLRHAHWIRRYAEASGRFASERQRRARARGASADVEN